MGIKHGSWLSVSESDVATHGLLKTAYCAGACVLYLLAACGASDEWSGPTPQPRGDTFVQDVYPALLRDCAFSTCHGAMDRFFHLYGPGRVRLDPVATKPDDPVTLPEVLHSYDRARSMIATNTQAEHSLLLSKPLEVGAGGQGHKGVDDFGRNVFASAKDPEYLLLLNWAKSTGAPPTAAQVAAIANAAPAAMP